MQQNSQMRLTRSPSATEHRFDSYSRFEHRVNGGVCGRVKAVGGAFDCARFPVTLLLQLGPRVAPLICCGRGVPIPKGVHHEALMAPAAFWGTFRRRHALPFSSLRVPFSQPDGYLRPALQVSCASCCSKPGLRTRRTLFVVVSPASADRCALRIPGLSGAVLVHPLRI